MDPERWRRIEERFHLLADLSPAQRARHLREIGTDDPELAASLAALLAADDAPGEVLASVEAILGEGSGPHAAAESPPLRADPLELSGRTVAHYRILEPLGGGGMGIVYRAEDTRLRRVVALKFLLPHLGLEPSARLRFLREAQLLAALDHVNLCTVHEVGEDAAGRLFLSMPLYPGETLKQRLARTGPLPIETAHDVARQVAEGLTCAHRSGIVHRDLKPGNLMLLPDGTVKILDFGLARARDATITGSAERPGTLAYMAPEQRLGLPVDGRADLWALGVILYEMLTGERPAGVSGTLEGAAARISASAPTRDHPRIPRAVMALLRELLRPSPDSRIGSAEEVRRRLEPEPHRPRSLRTGALRGGRALGLLLGRIPAQGRPLVLVAMVLAGVTVGTIVWRDQIRTPEVSGADARLAVLPFCVSAPAVDLRWGRDLALLVGQALDGMGNLRHLDHNTIATAAERSGLACGDRSAASAFAAREGADLVVLGNLVRAGRGWSASVSLHDARGARVAVASAEVPHDSLVLQLRDSLAVRIATSLPSTVASEALPEALVSTTSLTAVKEYLEGERRMTGEGDAGEAFQRAVGIDSTFALAWIRLSWLFDASGMDAASTRDAAARAQRYSARLPARERGFLDAWSAYLEADIPRAIELYRQHLGRYPDDVVAWGELADLQYHYWPLLGGSIGEAREGFERVLARRPRDWQALDHLTLIARFEQKHAEADRLRARARGDAPPDLWEATGSAARSGRVDALREVADRLARGNDLDAFVVPRIALEQGNPAAAEALLRVAVGPSRSARVRGLMYVHLARLSLMRGRHEAMEAALDSAQRFDPVAALEERALLAALPFVSTPDDEVRRLRGELRSWAPPHAAGPSEHPWIAPHESMHPQLRLYLVGLLSARLGDRSGALACADTLQGMPSPPEAPALSTNLATGIRAYLAWRAGDPRETLWLVEQIRPAVSFPYNHSSAFANHSLERYLRAEALRALRRHAEARRWYAGLMEGSPSHWVYREVAGRQDKQTRRQGDKEGDGGDKVTR